MARYWYFYTPAASGPFDPANYYRLSLRPDECPVGTIPCAIYALPSGISNFRPAAASLGDGTRLKSYIAAGSTTITDYLPVSGGSPYVYFMQPT